MERSFSLSSLLPAIVSCVLLAIYPSVTAEPIKEVGRVSAGFYIYLAASVCILFSLMLLRSKRLQMTIAWHHLLKEPFPYYNKLALLSTSIAACCFYLCLYEITRSGGHVSEVVVFFRLRELIIIPIAWWWYGEKASLVSLLGVVLAVLAGALLSASWGVFGLASIYAVIFTVSSAVARVFAKKVVSEDGLVYPLLFLRTFWVTTVLGVLLAIGYLMFPAQEEEWTLPSSRGVFFICISAFVLLGMFKKQFEAITALPLWIFSSVAAIIPFVAFLIRMQSGVEMSTTVYLAFLAFLIGEVLVAIGLHREK